MGAGLDRHARIFVAGHNGLIGSALCRRLDADGYTSVLTADVDLRDQPAVERWFGRHQPEYVFMAAGTVGGIRANSTRPAEFIYDNLAMQMAVLHAAYLRGVRKVMLFGSSCAYPKDAPQPVTEDSLLTGPLESTSEPYAVSKIAAMVMGRAYRHQYGFPIISVIPSTVYGPHDTFDPASGHVLPAMISRLHEAKANGVPEVIFWGSGAPVREFLFVDDLADAALFLMANYDGDQHLNVGTGDGVNIRDLALLVRDIVYPEARITFDRTSPDGSPHKVLDVSRLRALGWRHSTALADGLAQTYRWYVNTL